MYTLEKFYIPILVFFSSVIFVLLLSLISRKLKFFLDHKEKKHSIHKESIPRNGGIAIYLLFLLISYFFDKKFFLIVLSFLPAFFYGLYEDFKGNTPQKNRLFVMAVSSFLAIVLTGTTVENVGFLDLPEILKVPFTIFAVVGIASAFNFIDGLNGLSSGIFSITLIIFGFAAFLYQDFSLFYLSLIFSAIVLGFFFVNILTGKIFLGDSGAYFLGYFIAFSSLELINKHDITPWYPTVVLAYPIIETLFTIWRRGFRKHNHPNRSFFDSEKVHLHTLLYKRLVRKSNSLTSIFILIIFTFLGIFSFLFINNEIFLMIIFFTEAVIYIVLYRYFFRFLNKNSFTYSYLNKKEPIKAKI